MRQTAVHAATWMMEVSAVSAESKLGVNFADLYRESGHAKCASCLSLRCMHMHAAFSAWRLCTDLKSQAWLVRWLESVQV